MVPRLLCVLLLLFAALGQGAARADEPLPPGLRADSQVWLRGLTRAFPAGASAQQRKDADQQAAQALARKDTAAAVGALERRVGMGDVPADTLVALGQLYVERTPPDWRRALAAGTRAYEAADSDAAQLPALQLIARALRGQGMNEAAIPVLEAVIQRADTPENKALLADAQRAAGVRLRAVRLEPEAEPARACVAFTVPPTRRTDFQPQDWVRLEPPVAGAAATLEGREICVSGLPWGATTRLVFRSGLPAEQDMALAGDLTVPVAMPDRRPRIDFDTRFYILPRGQAPAVTLSTVNLSAVDLKLMRLTERNIPPFLRDQKLGEPVSRYTADDIGDTNGRVVWEGKADIPDWQRNRTARTRVPFPESLASGGPGLYALLATPGDGTREYGAASVQMVLRTDLAPTVWRGSDGLTVQVRSYADAAPRAGVRLVLLARNNDVLGEAATDNDGVARFPAALLRGEGPLAPSVLHAFGPQDDFTALDLTVAAFDLSDRGVSGQPNPGPIDSFVWLDRGIYRPGETVQVMALLRDAAGQSLDIPARVTVRRPNGQVFLQATPPRLPDGALHLPVVLSRGAAAGTWTIELQADPSRPPIGTAEFRVDTFVPDRLAVETPDLPKALPVGRKTTIPVTARFLYGAPAAQLSASATMRLVADPLPFADRAGWRFGLADEPFAPDQRDLPVPNTDGDGRTAVVVGLDQVPDTTRPLKAELDIAVNDPSGHASHAAASLPVRGTAPLIGIRPAFPDDAVNLGSEAGFDIQALTPDGVPTTMQARLRLVRERPDWRLVSRDGTARYETVWRDEPLETRALSLDAGAPVHVGRKLPWGRYRIEVSEAGGMAITSYRFRSGWASGDSPDVPDRVDVSVDRKTVPAGGSVSVHIDPPFAGQATLLVLTDKVQMLKTLNVPAGGTDVTVPVSADWGPGAYVTVHVFRGGQGDKRPNRAIGLAWVGIDPAARTLPVVFDAPARAAPRRRLVVPVHTAPGAWVSVAAVDEGILRLTRFASPDPVPHFLGRRLLGMDIRDDWGRLLAPADGTPTLLRQGGDAFGTMPREDPTRTVTLFVPPVQAGPDGTAVIPLDIGDYNGQVRLMAVGWQGTRIGGGATDVTVRDPLIAEALPPRFLAPGDEVRLPVLLHNLDLPAGEASAAISLEGPVALTGPDRLSTTLAPGASALPFTTLKATGAGTAVIRLAASGPTGFRVDHEWRLTVRPARPAVSVVSGRDVAPDTEVSLPVAAASFLPGTWAATASFGAPVRYDVAALTQALADYPMTCLEQVTSRGLPLAMLPEGMAGGMAATGDQAGRLQAAVAAVLDRQRYDGAFALWRAGGEAQPWLTNYALEFLLRARKAGAAVPQAALDATLKYLTGDMEGPDNTPEGRAEFAYRLYVLALAGRGEPGAARVLFEQLKTLPTPLSRAQLGAALALAHDMPRAETAFAAAASAPVRNWWAFDYGTTLRDRAATLVLMKENGAAPDRIALLAAALPGPDLVPQRLNTQEQAWLVAAAAVLGRDGTPVRVALNGTPLPEAPVVSAPLTQDGSVRNLGHKPVWASVASTGIPATPLPASRSQMQVRRRFLAMSGETLNLDTLRQNATFVLVLEGKVEDGQPHRVLLSQGLPAGWEVVGRIPDAAAAGLPWLTGLTDVEAQSAAEDRFAAVIVLDKDTPDFRVAVRLRAVTPGSFELPGAEVSDMYIPAVYARQGVNRIQVLPPE
ncbi:alpha-2-macroglobulin [Rhodopila sp.]|uniref:alpha-2-macroglobulin n=1 Tax=Rhodopila sp. TaxID=2480087 RepID=UPI002C5FE874|nr:alpha-2-macroglobulin [Rhodopila sp.]HVZ08353.1 alpha-2-macroglobulin [Rhodopila sp.]